VTALPERPGLQPERTSLAWQRTAITAAVVMVPLVVVSARLGFWLSTVLGSAATAGAAVLVVRVRHRFTQLREDHSPFSPYGPMVSIASATSLAATLALVTALVVVWS
jgi:uncharacterized membrane protein YidH (DUF202 family)